MSKIPAKHEAILKKWKMIIYDRANVIDPNQEIDWGDMAYGWFLAHNVNPEEMTLELIERGWL